jgi:anti-anti-sigma factor
MIDMKQVELIDSSGLMVLLKALRLVESMDRRLVLAQLHPSVQIIFEITGFDQIFNIVETANQVSLPIAA